MRDIVEELKKEESELGVKIQRLNMLIGSDEYMSLEVSHRELLVKQYNVMCEYRDCLKARILDLLFKKT